MSTVSNRRATIEDLAKVSGKAELVDGEIVYMSPSGYEHGEAGLVIAEALLAWRRKTKAKGKVFGDNVGFLCDLPHRQSFSPDAAWYTGPLPDDRRDFLPEPPVFAVEIRSKSDFGMAAEARLKAKRADYFAAGTRAVWDVSLQSDTPITLYLANAPDQPVLFHCCEHAHAEPILPGFSLELAQLQAL